MRRGALLAIAVCVAAGMAPEPGPEPSPDRAPAAKPPAATEPAKKELAKQEPAKQEPAPATPPTPEKPKPALDAPNPLIVEVLYAVPTGPAGDANQDGTRHASGDEFIELVNPHEKPIQLLGYTLVDGSQNEKSKMKFTFPACELAPGGVAVVFNGNAATWTGPVGDAKAAPAKGNDKFHGALVFTMRITSTKTALGNQGDEVTLIAPSGKPVQRLRWGTMAEGAKPDPNIPLEETLPMVTKCSVQRTGVEAGAGWRPHTEIDKRAFSPGEFGTAGQKPQ